MRNPLRHHSDAFSPARVEVESRLQRPPALPSRNNRRSNRRSTSFKGDIPYFYDHEEDEEGQEPHCLRDSCTDLPFDYEDDFDVELSSRDSDSSHESRRHKLKRKAKHSFLEVYDQGDDGLSEANKEDREPLLQLRVRLIFNRTYMADVLWRPISLKWYVELGWLTSYEGRFN